MISIKQTKLYDDVLKELNYSFADVFIFDGFIVSEIKEGITFSWEDHAEPIVMDVFEFTKSNGDDLVYLSHRIHSYSVQPLDWLKFHTNDFNLKGYGVKGYIGKSFINTVMESLFFNKKIRRFGDLESAIKWAKSKELSDLNA